MTQRSSLPLRFRRPPTWRVAGLKLACLPTTVTTWAMSDRLGPRTILPAGEAYDADRIRKLIQDQGVSTLR